MTKVQGIDKMMHTEYKDAFLEIISRYNGVYKNGMNSTDMKNVERLILSGLGFWESDEKNEKYYLFPCLAETI